MANGTPIQESIDNASQARIDFLENFKAFIDSTIETLTFDDTTTFEELEQQIASIESEADIFEGIAKSLRNMSASESDVEDALDAQVATVTSVDQQEAEETASDLVMTLPLRLTDSSGDNEHARMALDSKNNIWLVWHSTRTGIEEVYATKYFGQCGIWSAAGQGGEEIRITSFGQDNRRSMFPAVAIGPDDEAHVVFQTEDEEGGWEIFYSQSTGGGASFTKPVRVTRTTGSALSPDVAVVETAQADQGSEEKVVIVWHDDRFGNFEIMSAERVGGRWRSSGQDGTDIRITNAEGDSMFPRIDADLQGNLRLVYHDSRRGRGQIGIFMSTFVAMSGRWDSSAFGGSDRLISNSPADAYHPDVAIDNTGGTSVAWHDLRHALENEDQHEEVYALYCPRMGHPGGVHFPPLQPNIEARLDVDFEIVDCVNFEPITLTNAPEVCLFIRAPGATFWRGANEDGQFTDWYQFRPNYDLETMVVPWTLICTGGQKQVCVQVQDADMVGFPICRNVTLALQPPSFKVEFFEDEDLKSPLPTYKGTPVASSGDVFVKMTSEVPQILTPTFSVISRGQHLVFNQETEVLAVSGFSGANSAGIGSFVGTTFNVPREDDVSPVARAFSAAIGREFKSRFYVKRHDGLLHVDGLARLIPQGKDICDDVKAAPSTQHTATGIDVTGGTPTQPDVPDIVPDPDDCQMGTSSFSVVNGTTTPELRAWVIVGGGGVPYEVYNQSVGGGTGNYALGAPFSILQGGVLKSVTIMGYRTAFQPAFNPADRTFRMEIHENAGQQRSTPVAGAYTEFTASQLVVAPRPQPSIVFPGDPDMTVTLSGLSMSLCRGQYVLVLRGGGDPMVAQHGFAYLLCNDPRYVDERGFLATDPNLLSVWINAQPSSFAAGGEIFWPRILQTRTFYMNMSFDPS